MGSNHQAASPLLVGFTSEGEEVHKATTSSSDDSSDAATAVEEPQEPTPKQRQRVSRTARNRASSLPQRDARGRFVSAKGREQASVPGSVGEAYGDSETEGADSEQSGSLVWDNLQHPLLNATGSSRH
jgi:hypothetical protein